MTIVRTDLGDTRESASELRFSPVGAVTKTNVQAAIEQVATQVAPPAPPVVGTNINFGMSPYTVLAADTVLYVDTSGGAVEIRLQAALDRAGVPISIKDVTGNAAANNITLTPNGAETIDGLASLPIDVDFGGYRLNAIANAYTVAP